jgi:hypothetical protein
MLDYYFDSQAVGVKKWQNTEGVLLNQHFIVYLPFEYFYLCKKRINNHRIFLI